MGYSGAGGKLIHKKNQKQKISWHCPFNNLFVSPLFQQLVLNFFPILLLFLIFYLNYMIILSLS
jgi:hypothetical protein